ncbi:MAG: transposase [Phaeodactylibacter sp.]|nr:transposase [Phaeodactylibacter sp.]
MKDPKLLDLYSDYLLASFRMATATGLSELTDQALSHDKVSRFLGQEAFTAKDYWYCIKRLVRSVEHPDAIIKIDDTIEEKPHSTENEVICWHWDHSKKPKAGHVKGINILNFLYQSPLGIELPVAFEIIRKSEEYVDSKSGQVKKRSPRSKNEMLRDQLFVLTKYNRVPFRYVVWDTWFSAKENFEFVHFKLKKHFIGALKSNRKVALSMEDKLEGKFHRVDGLELQAGQANTVYLKGLDFPLQLVKQAFTNKDGSTGDLYLVTNDLDLDAPAICTTYETRWGVEVFHKSLKQNVGLEKSPTKHETSQCNHVFAAMIAWTKLELLSVKEQANHFALKTKMYVKALRAAYEEVQRLKAFVPKIDQPDLTNTSLLR